MTANSPILHREGRRRGVRFRVRRPLVAILLLWLCGLTACSTSPEKYRDMKACLDVLQRIEVAKRTMAMGHGLGSGITLTAAQTETLATFMTGGTWAVNQCPCGGKYNVGRFGESPSCSIHGNLKDIKLYNYSTD